LLNLEETTSYSFYYTAANFDRKTADKTQWEVPLEVPVAKSARSFQGDAGGRAPAVSAGVLAQP